MSPEHVLRRSERLRFTNTFAVHLRWWWYRLLAEGYEPSEWAELNVPEFWRQVQRPGSGKAKLVVRGTLAKSA